MSGDRHPNALSADQILEHMAQGWKLVAGNGIYSYVTKLIKDGKEMPVWRNRLGALRDAGLIVWRGPTAELTVAGRAAAGRLLAVSVQTRSGRRADRRKPRPVPAL